MSNLLMSNLMKRGHNMEIPKSVMDAIEQIKYLDPEEAVAKIEKAIDDHREELLKGGDDR